MHDCLLNSKLRSKEGGYVEGTPTLIKEGYGSEYFENSISNDGALLVSGIPATN